MKYLYLLIIFIITINLNALDFKVSSRAFYASVEINELLNTAKFTWDDDSSAFYYIIRKKSANDLIFVYVDSLQGNAINWTDSNVDLSQVTEYSIIKNFYYISPVNSEIDTLFSYSYPVIGSKIPANHFRGAILLLIDDTFQNSLSTEINRLKLDLIGDGWKTYIKYVPRSENFSAENVLNTKQVILDIYKQDPSLNSVLLLGRVAVPYSGVTAPDGHQDHMGAWPCDLYYGDIDGIWTDSSANNNQARDPRNHNLIGDGKFDQNIIPSDIDLAIGRIDFYNLPTFTESEEQLLRNYLNKNHKYRNGEIQVTDSAIVDDRFGAGYSEAFAATGLMNFYTLLGNRVNKTDYLRFAIKDSTRSFKWFYGCGPGSYNAAHDIAYTDEFAVENHYAIFAMIFGSYHGDWDSENNVLRAALASNPSILNVMWSGRPAWLLMPMLFGNPIGEALKLTQNYDYEQYPNMSFWGTRRTHTALQGDPTLTNDILSPVWNLSAEHSNSFEIKLSWEYSEDNDGYYVYKSEHIDSAFTLLNEKPVMETNYLDNFPNIGKNIYMVRANKLQEHHYGSYYNLSNGKIIEVEYQAPESSGNLFAYPNPANDKIMIYLDEKQLGKALKIYDVLGKEVHSQIAEKSIIEINLQSISAGIYYINIGAETIPIVKM